MEIKNKYSIEKLKQFFIEALKETRRERLRKQGKMLVDGHVANLWVYPLCAVQYKNDSQRLEDHLVSMAKNEYDGSITEALHMHELFLQRIGAWDWIKKKDC